MKLTKTGTDPRCTRSPFLLGKIPRSEFHRFGSPCTYPEPFAAPLVGETMERHQGQVVATTESSISDILEVHPPPLGPWDVLHIVEVLPLVVHGRDVALNTIFTIKYMKNES